MHLDFKNILGTPTSPDVPGLDQKETKATALRERLGQHRANAVSASCHSKMDPLGFAVEIYDTLGALRKTEGNKGIDVSGTLPQGRKINGLNDLEKPRHEEKEKLARHMAERY